MSLLSKFRRPRKDEPKAAAADELATAQKRSSRLKRSGVQPAAATTGAAGESQTATPTAAGSSDGSRESSVRDAEAGKQRKKSGSGKSKAKRFGGSRASTEKSENGLEELTAEEEAAVASQPQPYRPPRPPPPEITTCSAEQIAKIKRLEEAGRIDVDFETFRAAAAEFAKAAANLTPKGALEEYKKKVVDYVPENTTKVHFNKNPQRNRYRDVHCADRERVVLESTPSNAGDYIHANHVRGDPLPPGQHFICTQGPTASTCLDFWRMVRQENTRAIVMLCETREQGREKCHQYWPLNDQEVLRMDEIGLTVRNCGRFVHTTAFVTTILEVCDERSGRTWELLHHRWGGWPDYGVPRNESVLFKLLQLVRSTSTSAVASRSASASTSTVTSTSTLTVASASTATTPETSTAPDSSVVFHCSAGIGRTGTIVGVELAIQTLLRNECPSMVDLVHRLREKRLYSVQTDTQYVFIYKLLLSFVGHQQPDEETMAAIQQFNSGFWQLTGGRKSVDSGAGGAKAEVVAEL
ncbi:Receptor-type tyrosine-protein phosphatase epsilon [Aphelenchoides fujianensis]|nr:Receptor-type tyrosine-protein phosphatase epsilon [Aphelenchoides fujianensis]